jgi:hypothetical protein
MMTCSWYRCWGYSCSTSFNLAEFYLFQMQNKSLHLMPVRLGDTINTFDCSHMSSLEALKTISQTWWRDPQLASSSLASSQSERLRIEKRRQGAYPPDKSWTQNHERDRCPKQRASRWNLYIRGQRLGSIRVSFSQPSIQRPCNSVYLLEPSFDRKHCSPSCSKSLTRRDTSSNSVSGKRFATVHNSENI